MTDEYGQRIVRCSDVVAQFLLGLKLESYDEDGVFNCGVSCVTYAEGNDNDECYVKLSRDFVEYLATGTFDWGDGKTHDDDARPLTLVYREPVDATEMLRFLYGQDFIDESTNAIFGDDNE